MAWNVPEDYQTFSKHWKHLGFSDWPGRRPADLKFPINPIFERTTQNRRLFSGIVRQYRLIERAPRLASAFFSTPSSTLYNNWLVYEIKRLPSQFDSKQLLLSFLTLMDGRWPLTPAHV